MTADTPSFHEVGHIQVIVIVRPQRSRFRAVRLHGRDVGGRRMGRTGTRERCPSHKWAGTAGAAKTTGTGWRRLLLIAAAGGLEARRPGQRMSTIKASSDDRDSNLIPQGVVDDRAEDDVCLVMRGFLDELGGRRDLEQPEVRAARDRQQHSVGAVDARLEQRGGDGHFCRGPGPVLAASRSDAHQGRASLAHDRFDVREVEVDQARSGDQVRDAGNTLHQNLVRLFEGIEDGHLVIGHLKQLVVGDDDQGVDLLPQRLYTRVGLGGATAPFKGKGACHHPDGQGAEGTSDLGHDGRSSRAGATSLTCRDENHVGPLEGLLDVLGMILGGLFSALVSLLQYLSDAEDTLPSIVFWLMGSFASASGDKLLLLAVPVALASAVLLGLRWRLNLLSLGEREARALNVNIHPLRWTVIFCSGLIVACQVAVSGSIGWVGLIIPHLGRMLIGADHQRLLPCAMLLGAAYMIVVDDLARTLSQSEIPVSIITALLGAPVFAFLVYRLRRSATHHE